LLEYRAFVGDHRALLMESGAFLMECRVLQMEYEALFVELREGAGIRPDYLMNRADKKFEGPLGKKIARKSKNSRRVCGGGVSAEGMVTKLQIGGVLEPNTNAERMLLLSHLLRSAWGTLGQDCWGFPRSLK